MEALTAVSVAALTVYDMVKAVDKAMVISDIRLEFKSDRPLGHAPTREQGGHRAIMEIVDDAAVSGSGVAALFAQRQRRWPRAAVGKRPPCALGRPVYMHDRPRLSARSR